MWIEIHQHANVIALNKERRKDEDVYVIHGVDTKGIECIWYDQHLGKWIFRKDEVSDACGDLNYLAMTISVRALVDL